MPPESRAEPIDIVLPAHNEGLTIGGTLREFHEQVVEDMGIPIRFVVCEDGSTDNTVDVLKSIADDLPILLITDTKRKGYSRAVVDGLRATTSAIVGFIDSDGQCDPRDFKELHERIAEADLVLGYRNPRRDHWFRKLMSGAFRAVYRIFFNPRVRDPSCPYLLINRAALNELLEGNLGLLKQGFWWEFSARSRAAGLRIVEVPVNHRIRAGGTTQVYRVTKVPRIAVEHFIALFALRKELRTRKKLIEHARSTG